MYSARLEGVSSIKAPAWSSASGSPPSSSRFAVPVSGPLRSRHQVSRLGRSHPPGEQEERPPFGSISSISTRCASPPIARARVVRENVTFSVLHAFRRNCAPSSTTATELVSARGPLTRPLRLMKTPAASRPLPREVERSRRSSNARKPSVRSWHPSRFDQRFPQH